MEVVAFVGSSGTGKSHRALVVAHENNIECIIDDGILIHDNKIVAGFSAKKESSRLKAVRRAIFQDEVQVKSVREQLDKINPNKLMIIGTSDNMVKKITIFLKFSSKTFGSFKETYYLCNHLQEISNITASVAQLVRALR